MPKRNQSIEVCRFVAALLILCHHSRLLTGRTLFVGGWVFVEFFFMLTGYFTARHVCVRRRALGASEPGSDTPNVYASALSYVGKKIRPLVPFAWLGILLGFVAYTLRKGVSFASLLSLPYNLLLLGGSSIASKSVIFDPPLWYVTILILALPPLVVALNKWPDAFRYLLSWLVPILCYSYVMDAMGKTAVWEVGLPRLMRGVADLMLGTLIYYLTDSAQDHPVLRGRLPLCKVAGLALFAVVCWQAVVAPGGRVRQSSEFMCLCAIATLLMLMDNRNYLDSPVVYGVAMHLGQLSMPLFCLHHPILQLIQVAMPTWGYKSKLALGIVVSLVASEVVLRLYRLAVSQRKGSASSTSSA